MFTFLFYYRSTCTECIPILSALYLYYVALFSGTCMPTTVALDSGNRNYHLSLFKGAMSFIVDHSCLLVREK